MKAYVSKGFSYFLALFVSGWIAVAASFLPILIYRFCMPMDPITMDTTGEDVVTILVMTFVMVVSMFLRSYRIGYKNGTFDLTMIIISFVVGVVFHLIYNLVFDFAFYTAGPAHEVGKLMFVGGKRLEVALPAQYVAVNIWYFYLLYLGAVCLGERAGVKKRLRDREGLTAAQNDSK